MFLKKLLAKYAKQEVTGSVYYVTVDGKDYEYNRTLDKAKTNAMNALKDFPKAKVLIEVFTGTQHGGGGTKLYTLKLDAKTKKFSKV
jgi:hypothetical protein